MTVKKNKHQIDVTAEICPITFVKVKLRLEELEAGEILEVYLEDGEAVQNVPRSLRLEGHKIHSLTSKGEGVYRLQVEKGE